jgi:hypothetical protein
LALAVSFGQRGDPELRLRLRSSGISDQNFPPRYSDPFFGGAHYCLGGWLARTELQVALNAILDRWDTINITGDVHWRTSFVLRALDALPLTITHT